MNDRTPKSRKFRLEIAEKSNFTCQECGEVGDYCNKKHRVLSRKLQPIKLNYDHTYYERIPMEFDHILPFSLGGKTELNNMQILCRKCNRRKKDRM